MHEHHLLKDLLSDLLKAAHAHQTKKVTHVYLRMGEFTEINPEILLYFFKENTKGTCAEAAQVHVEKSKKRELALVSFDCE